MSEPVVELRAEWVADPDGADPDPDRWTLPGGDNRDPTWDEYLEKFTDEGRPYLEAARACVEREALVGKTAEEVANDFKFQFSDGKTLCFSWRAWGDFMQAIVGEREGYMAYYSAEW